MHIAHGSRVTTNDNCDGFHVGSAKRWRRMRRTQSGRAKAKNECVHKYARRETHSRAANGLSVGICVCFAVKSVTNSRWGKILAEIMFNAYGVRPWAWRRTILSQESQREMCNKRMGEMWMCPRLEFVVCAALIIVARKWIMRNRPALTTRTGKDFRRSVSLRSRRGWHTADACNVVWESAIEWRSGRFSRHSLGDSLPNDLIEKSNESQLQPNHSRCHDQLRI